MVETAGLLLYSTNYRMVCTVWLRLWSPNQNTKKRFTALLRKNKTFTLKRKIFNGMYTHTVNVIAQHGLAGLLPRFVHCSDELRSPLNGTLE